MLKTFSSDIRILRVILITLLVIAIIGTGASSLIVHSVFAPVYVGLVLFAFAILIFWLSKPVWALYVTLLVLFIPRGFIPLEWESILNRTLTVVSLAVWFLGFTFQHKRIVWSTAHWFFVGFLLWSLISFFWSVYIEVSQTIIQVYSLRFILFFIILINQICTDKDLDRLMTLLALIGWVTVISSVTTVLFTGYLPGTRFQALSEGPNGLGMTALMALPGILWKTTRSVKSHISIHHLLAIFYFVLAIVIIAISGSRGTAISFSITVLVLFAFRQTRSWAFLCLLILLLALLIAPFIFTTTIERFLATGAETVLGGREILWLAGIDLITSHPWFGVGIGNSSYVVMPYLSMYASISGSTWANLHNPLLVIWADTGILGLFFYLGILVSCILGMVRTYYFQRRQGLTQLYPYFSLVLAVFLGYMASWIKGGGLESDHSYYFMLALLLVPANLDLTTWHEAPQ